MKMIYKYNLGNPYHNLVSIEKMPKGAKVLDAQMQNDDLVLWALVNPKHSEKEKTFHIYGTGFELTEYEKKHYDYLTTVQTAHGLVWHVFEVYE